MFKREHIFARSLFLDTAESAVQCAGPWLVALDQAPDTLDKVFALSGDRPAMMYWRCAVGETVLYRHLRTLNMARIPKWAADGAPEPPHGTTEAEVYESVMFRHWDPRVLGALMPCLDASQFARVLGPGDEITFWTDDYGGLKRIVADGDWPAAKPGLLTVRSAQIQMLSTRKNEASQKRVAKYLRLVAPDIATPIPDNKLHDFVHYCDVKGRELGIKTEAGQSRWAYIMLVSGGRVLDTPGAISFITQRAPDDNVKILIDRVAERVRQLGARGSVV